ncbi:uncharacterized protein [Coffea arabica]|uniref:Transcription factor TFIIIC triple barrel domain-containing protein n=1 Tax=Coffea arabica TaxID=13443 RepID=A0A6P6X4R2_COFAR|nr:uncharacterized protein LOC113739660 [Coffea arabica]XP_027122733.1 uncharacterized protein LOC113739660 [Coffea arabica]XP_027122734.1 uncharacterized protein LOC113739660 [Coffea arabica]XP_027122735.1 uncharacterized protein LOC113739660 [Coffea arabica]
MMEGNNIRWHQDDKREEEVEEEEYVLINLDAVTDLVNIPPNAPYVLSGLDTLNPTLIIDEKFRLIGEYEETIGTCLVFSECDAAPELHQETGPSEANLFTGRCIVDNKRAPTKQVKPITQLHKILKFRLAQEADIGDSTAKQTNIVNNENSNLKV